MKYYNEVDEMSRSEILDIDAAEVYDSRGNPTVYVNVQLPGNISGFAMVPSGASTGEHEAHELRDEEDERLNGKGVLSAVENINDVISLELTGMEVTEQSEIDRLLIELDNTSNKKNLGANAIVGVSMACARAASNLLNIPLYRYIGGITGSMTLPVPMLNVINGGKHADNNVDFQEYMIVPLGAPTFAEAIRYAAETIMSLKDLLKSKGLSVSVGDEGGFAPDLRSNEEPLELLMKAVSDAGYTPGNDIAFAIDVAASEIYNKKENQYSLKAEDRSLSAEELIDYYEKIVSNYPIISIEDGLDENDWMGWKMLTKRMGNKVILIGDDIFVTNPERLTRGIKNGVANAILIKLNQIGTVTETLETIRIAKNAGYNIVISHRSGETEDTFIADFAVGTGALLIKTGSLCRSERVAKYNRLILIERELDNAIYLGQTLTDLINSKE